ncbi:MAG: nucleolar RNA-binding Nop10p family protein [Candidatus ainarchaeum sp.]|nr:nucleolar RNA-binding Nop10p family protein [Candidatus ainarchaeum sp.]
MRKILKCRECGAYTLSQKCAKCGGAAGTSAPPKYSSEDKWAAYRRRYRFPEGNASAS